MTSEDVFLGGGSSSGQFNRANLPNIKGEDIPGNFTTNSSNSNFDLVSYVSYGDTSKLYGSKSSSGLVSRKYVSTNEMYNVIQNKTGNRPGQLYQDGGGQPVMSGYYFYYVYDASWYNSTYNDSNRVNPNYYTVEYWIKYK